MVGCRNDVKSHSRPPVLTFVSLCLFRRLTYESLAALEIPSDLLQTVQDLVLDLRVRCVVVTLQHTAEGALRKLMTLLSKSPTHATSPASNPQQQERYSYRNLNISDHLSLFNVVCFFYSLLNTFQILFTLRCRAMQDLNGYS